MTKLKGACTCGKIRYEITGSPAFSFHCQCRQCQRLTGTGHSSQFMMLKENVIITGNVKFYKQTTDGNNTKSVGFCADCGNPILTKVHEYPDNLFFHAANLDDPRLFKPEKVLYSISKQPWDYVDPDLETE